MRITKELQNKIAELRRLGLSHRQIAKRLGVGQGSAVNYSKSVKLTREQHLFLMREHLKKSLSKLTLEQRLAASRRGGVNAPYKFKKRTSKRMIIGLIREFYKSYNRVPFKKEFHHSRAARALFGSWNMAIEAAGFIPNPVKFSKKCIADDGHICDSLAEKIIDDFLYSRKIQHERNVRYVNTKFTADFKLGETFVEFFGLHGQNRKYDELMIRKLALLKKHKLKLIALYPEEVFPYSQLDKVLLSRIK